MTVSVNVIKLLTVPVKILFTLLTVPVTLNFFLLSEALPLCVSP